MDSPQTPIEQPLDKPWRLIRLDDDHVTIVDDFNFTWLSVYPWKLYRHFKSYYAKYLITRWTKPITICMHRLVAKTPKGMVTHHRNRNTLDNRRGNLINMTPKDHEALHKNHTLLIKFSTVGPLSIDLAKFFSR